VRFWDTSALVPLLIQGRTSPEMDSVLQSDLGIALWWGAIVEGLSALTRAEREGRLGRESVLQGLQLLPVLREGAVEVQPSEELRLRAMRLLSVHPLRAADSLQLAAALIWCRERPAGQEFVCLDRRLRDAALREGFTLVPEME